jgi:hypothetical protein
VEAQNILVEAIFGSLVTDNDTCVNDAKFLSERTLKRLVLAFRQRGHPRSLQKTDWMTFRVGHV